MPKDDPFRIFVSHLWRDDDDDYLRLFDYLGDTENFFYVNCSKPDEKPIGGKLDIQRVLHEQMQNAEVVIILASHYVQDPELIALQLSLAKRLTKPVIAVEPFGPESMHDDVRAAADTIVPWYNRSIVDAIHAKGRGDDTSRFDVIDFP